jgi:hypothetical protein
VAANDAGDTGDQRVAFHWLSPCPDSVTVVAGIGCPR